MLKLQDISVDIAGIPVLRKLSVEFKPGASYAVLGRNGAGKTTLLRTVMGFAPVKAGSITLAGSNLLLQPSFSRASLGIGYAPEERVLFPTLSVLDNLRLPCEAIGLRQADITARLQQVLQSVPLIEPLLPRSAAALSGGQGKMAALARALMVGSKFLLVDEPFQGLAPALAQQYAHTLGALVQMQPELCIVITESNRALLHGIDCTTMLLERGELKGE